MEHDSLVIAVTGGMGCGQSSVCEFLKKHGVKVINADEVARKEIEQNPEVQQELKKAFGSRVFYRNGKLNRKYLARKAFSDEAQTQRLNRIVHPRMVARILEIIESARESGKYEIIAVDAALIYELNLEKNFDAVVVVASRMRQRIERIKNRDGLSDREIIDRINKQIPIQDKIKWADFVVYNYGTLQQLEQKTVALYHNLKKMARKKIKVS
ncbi:MAG: dephospho-CoA kinase [Calditrichia bacterium]